MEGSWRFVILKCLKEERNFGKKNRKYISIPIEEPNQNVNILELVEDVNAKYNILLN